MSRLQNIKIKFRSAAPAGTIYVFQDGSASDPDVTSGRRYDNAIRAGASPPGTTLQNDKQYLELVSMDHSYDTGKQLNLALTGRKAWLNDPAGAIQLGPNDKVELFADRPDADSSVVCASWHLNQQSTGQLRIFYGFIASVDSTPEGGLKIVCKDGAWKANDIRAERDTSGGITIPKIAFNVDLDNADWFYSIKITAPGTGTPWSTGEATTAASKMTVKEILEYLDSRYYSKLVTEGAIDNATAASIFASADLASLTFIPPAIVAENIGFRELVQQVLQWAPDMRLVVDHRTTQWRLLRTGLTVKSTSTTTTTSIATGAGPYGSKVSVVDPSLFSASPGVTGNRVRIYSSGNPALNLERTVQAIVGSELRFYEFSPTGGGGFGSGSRIVPIDGNALPTLTLNLDNCPKGDPKIGLDLDRVYSAVKFYSVYQKTTSETVAWNSTDLAAGALQPGWKSGFNSAWKDKDKDRESDFGSKNADGNSNGCRVYKIDNDGTFDRIWIRYSDSAFGSDHVNDEWKGCVLWVWTINGADSRSLDRVYRIRASTNVADAGDGTPGFRLTLDVSAGQFLTDSPTFKPVNDPSATEDRVAITQNMRFQNVGSINALPAENNARWEVGRKWSFTGTTIRFDASSSPHVSVCTPLKLQVDDGTGNFRRVAAMTSQMGYPSRNQNPAGPWVQVAGGGPGSFQVYRRNSFYTRTPAAAPCPSGYQPPRLIQVEYERTTTTMRTARYPASGFAGVAFERFGLAREWAVTTPNWTEDNQDADYTAMVERFWNAFSKAHQRGSVTMPGVKERGVFIDLAIHASLSTSLAPQTQSSMVLGFWGAVTQVTLDFQSDSVVFDFDSKSPIQDLAFEVYEKMGVSIASKVEDLLALTQKLGELPKCLAGSQLGETPTGMCAEVVYEPGGRSILPKLRLPSKDNQANHSTASSYDFAGAW